MYDAITVDTNIFDEQQLNLEGGLLKQLYQFKDGSPKFVLSEIVVREVGRHLQRAGRKRQTQLYLRLLRVREGMASFHRRKSRKVWKRPSSSPYHRATQRKLG